jgi:hypothetical protein
MCCLVLGLILCALYSSAQKDDISIHWKKTGEVDEKQIVCLQFAVKHDRSTLDKLETVGHLNVNYLESFS